MRFPFFHSPAMLLLAVWWGALGIVVAQTEEAPEGEGQEKQTDQAEPLPIASLWKSEAFQKVFTGSYGIDSRIEPKVTSEEKSVLDAVADEMAAEDRDGAIQKLTAQSSLNDSAALIFALGNLRFEEGRTEDAVANFERAIELYPNFRDAHRNLAVALVQESQFDRAEPHLVRSLELGARDGLTLGLLGYCHASAGRNQAALQAYRLAQLTMPEEPQWQLGEAHALLGLDEARASASLYTGLMEKRPFDHSLWINQADAFLQLGEPEKGIANLEFARRLGGLSPAETLSLGHLYLNEALPDAALVCYHEAIAAESAAPLTKAVDAVENLTQFRYWEKAQALAAEIGAIPIYADALARTSDSGEASAEGAESRSRLNRCLALIELEVGDPTEGERLVKELIDRDPLDAPALILMARFHESASRFEEAEMLLEQAARDSDYESEALRSLGELLVRQSRFQEAIEPLRQALGQSSDPNLRAYLELVEQAAK